MVIGVWELIFIAIFLFLAFLPTYISFKRSHKNKLWVFILSWAGYWTYGVTWIMALAWALAGETDSNKTNSQSQKPFSETPLGAHSAKKLESAENKLAQEKKSEEAKDIEKKSSQLEPQEEKNKSIEARIRRVKSMSENGLITEAQAADKIDTILNEL